MFKKTITKWFKNNREILTFVFVSFFTWRVWLEVFLWLGWFILPLREILLGGGIENFLIHPGFWAWANFDGGYYVNIAYRGYGSFEQVFFPFYPWLIRTLASFLGRDIFVFLISGLIISRLTFIIALFLFYFLIRLDYDKKVSQMAIVFLLFFPTSFFFGAAYTESLFLALVLGSFYAARKRKWLIAGILGALASGTRLVGIFLLPAFLWEWWEQNKIKNEKLKMKNLLDLAPILLVSAGLLYYMRFLATNYHDPLMFLHVQPILGVQKVADKIILFYQVIWRYLKMIASTKMDYLYFTVWLEFLTGVCFLGLLVFAYLKKIRLSYIIFSVLLYITPTLTGTFSSMTRYVLVLFPCFISMALLKNRIIKILLFTFYFLLLIVSTIFFTRGYFVG